MTCPRIGALEVVLEVAVLREDVVEGLVHDIVGSGVNKGRILVDESGGGFVEPDRCVDLSALNDFK